MHPLLFISPSPTYTCIDWTLYCTSFRPPALYASNASSFYKPLFISLSFSGRSDLTTAYYRTSTEVQEAARDAHRDEDKTIPGHSSSRRSSSNDNESREEGTSTDNIPSAHGIPVRHPPLPPVESSDSVDIISTGETSHEECGEGGDGDSSSPSHDAVLNTQGKPQQQQQSEGVVSARSGDHDHENGSPAAPKVAKCAWEGMKVVAERAFHVRREIKAVFSSELERCLLKVSAAREPGFFSSAGGVSSEKREGRHGRGQRYPRFVLWRGADPGVTLVDILLVVLLAVSFSLSEDSMSSKVL